MGSFGSQIYKVIFIMAVFSLAFGLGYVRSQAITGCTDTDDPSQANPAPQFGGFGYTPAIAGSTDSSTDTSPAISDYCIDQLNLNEYFCKPDGASTNYIVNCPSGCSNGACISLSANPEAPSTATAAATEPANSETIDLTKTLSCPVQNPDDEDDDGVVNAQDVCQGGNDKIDTDKDSVADDCDLCPTKENKGENVGKNSVKSPSGVDVFFKVPEGSVSAGCKTTGLLPGIKVEIDGYSKNFVVPRIERATQNQATATTQECADTDDLEKSRPTPDIQGSYGYNLDINGEITLGSAKYSDICATQAVLQEAYCHPLADGSYTVQSRLINCANGCFNGICIPSSQKPTGTCTDTDDPNKSKPAPDMPGSHGYNPDIAGNTISTEGPYYTDTCLSFDQLFEYFCATDNAILGTKASSKTIGCPNGCSNGACNQKSTDYVG